MSKPLGYLNTASSTFADLFNFTNTMLQVFANEVVTANSAAGGGAMTTGNGFVTGIFGANTIVASQLQGGNVSFIQSLYLASNLVSNGTISVSIGSVFTNTTDIVIGGTFQTNATGWFVGNANNNIRATNTQLQFHANGIGNGMIDIVNSLMYLNSPNASFYIGNSSTTYTQINTSGFFITSSVPGQPTAVYSPTRISIGNSLVNAVVNSSGFYFDGTSVMSAAAGVNTAVQFNTTNPISGQPSFTGTNAFTFNASTNSAYIANNLSVGSVNVVSNVTTNSITVSQTAYVNGFSVIPTTQTLIVNATGNTISWALSAGQITTVTVSLANSIMNNPTNVAPGYYVLLLKQPATSNGNTLRWGNTFLFANGTPPTLSTNASAIDMATFISDGTYLYNETFKQSYAV